MKNENVVIYTRVSTRTVSTREESIAGQIDLCEEFCEDNGFDVVAGFCDVDTSSTSNPFTRPVLKEAIKRCLEHRASLVVAENTRISRSIADIITFTRYLNSIGIEVIIVNNERLPMQTHDENPINLAEYLKEIVADVTGIEAVDIEITFGKKVIN